MPRYLARTYTILTGRKMNRGQNFVSLRFLSFRLFTVFCRFMKDSAVQIIRYAAWLALAVLLVWFSLRWLQPPEGQDQGQFLLTVWHRADKRWLWLMALVMMVSHLVRAERWRMLLVTTGHRATLFQSLLSLLVGYLVNLVIPRGGEVSRCLNLYRLSRYPVDKSFGTVVAERAIDLLCFAFVLLIAFWVEYSRLKVFVASLSGRIPPLPGLWVWIMAGGMVALLFPALRFIRMRFPRFAVRIRSFGRGFVNGLKAALHVNRSGLFIAYSLAIWVLYFLMSYAVIMAFEETRILGLRAVLGLFAIGALAMVLPLPGGTGSYHTLVPAGMTMLYGIPLSEAVAFTIVFHGWQTLLTIGGGIPALLTSAVQRRKKSLERF